jgi:hypothetical protein
VTSSTGRGAPWWQVALAHEGAGSLEPGEPWAETDLDDTVAGLSDDQRALLTGVEDQPAVPRLRDLPPPGEAAEGAP